VIVLDINKLAREKKGDGLTLPTSLFADGCNLVLVDEGHKGQKSEAGVWKAVQADLAGINAPIAAQRGLLIEFSATFGQVVEGENALGRYAKAIVFDYAYDRFHQDRYGKDFWHVRVQSGALASADTQRDTLTAALLAFWHQVACFRSAAAQQAMAAERLQVSPPLWVLLGLSVIGSSKNKDDVAQTSDVVDVLRFLHGILAQPAELAACISQLARTATVGTDLLPPEVRQIVTDAAGVPDITGQPAALQVLAQRVLADCFGWQAGDKPVLRLLRAATGELGLGLLRGDMAFYWGVVNVGDAVGLKKALESNGLAVQDDALSGSLFAALDAPGSGVNVLIGSRRFAEGWDNFRACSLTLLRLGQGEGSLIIQMFGRVVRFAGVAGDGKRLQRPSPALAALQTAYVFGLKSGYLDVFLQSLGDNGVLDAQRIDCPVVPTPVPPLLQAVRAVAPKAHEFAVPVLGGDWVAGINEVTLSLGASMATSRLQDGTVSAEQGKLGQDITDQFKKLLPLVDRNALFCALIEWRRNQRWWNLSFDRAAIDAALDSDRFRVTGLADMLRVRQAADLQRLQRLALSLVRRLFEAAYRKQLSRHSRYALAADIQGGVPGQYYKEVCVGD